MPALAGIGPPTEFSPKEFSRSSIIRVAAKLTLLRRHASARQALARALGYIDPLLAAGVHLGLAGAGVGGTRAIVLACFGHSIAFLHVGLVGCERGRRYCR